MEDTNTTSRYHRKRVSGTRGKNRHKSIAFSEKLALQTALCVLLLIVVFIIRKASVPMSDQLTNKLNWVVTNNAELTDIYSGIDSSLEKIRNSEVLNSSQQNKNSTMDETHHATIDQDSIVQMEEDNNENPETNNDNTSEENSSSGEENTSDVITQEEEIKKVNDDNDIITQIKQKYKFINPVDGALGSPFGLRINPIKKTREFHKGVDIKVNNGTSIKAALSGEVFAAYSEKSYGNFIIIKHSDGITTLYAHCSKLLVKAGQKVKQGQIIAKAGSTGFSTGPHLHFEVSKDGKLLNPLSFIYVRQ